MPVIITQKPENNILPIGQEVMFAVTENTTVATMYRVKFRAEIHVSQYPINFSSAGTIIGNFKTTPNNKGVGIFNIKTVLETFVKSDNLGSTFGNGSRYKTSEAPHPLHLIDKYAVSENSIKYFGVQFKVEFADTPTGDLQVGFAENSEIYEFFNGVLQYDDPLYLRNGNYGYNINRFFPRLSGGAAISSLLSNAPNIQYARLTDYGTFPFLNFLPDSTDKIVSFDLNYYWDGGNSNEQINQGWTSGGYTNYTVASPTHLMYFGAFPANLQNTSTTFATAISNGLTHYTVRAKNAAGFVGASYRINIICPNERGYEGIRLTWLNQWGTWDYYTFNQKSITSISTTRTPYTQLGGTWNDNTFKINGYKGGKKNFRVNAIEKIKLNTGFVTEEEGVWFEELINSTEVYIVNEFESGDDSATMTNKYIEPVTLTTSSYTKKTKANDKLMQYTIEIEKSKTRRIQSV